jgi:hypothetical protein
MSLERPDQRGSSDWNPYDKPARPARSVFSCSRTRSFASRLKQTTALLFLAGLLFGCSSEAIDRGGQSTGGQGGTGASGGSGATGGTGASGGSAGTTPIDIPDYTASPCYGESAKTSVYNLATHVTREITATCRAEGNRTRLYVADELWETLPVGATSPLTQEEVDAFMVGYELRGAPGSYRPDLGILPTNELVFGELTPGSLTDGKLPIFVIDSGGAGEGYLCGWCDRTELHLDYLLLGSLHDDEALSIAAHETFHAIHRGYDGNETFWLDEALAEAAMTVNGYFTDALWLSSFLNDTNSAWGPGLDDVRDFNYGAGLLLGNYLWEQGGVELLHAITHEADDGWEGIEKALESVGSDQGAWRLWGNLALATFLDDPATNYEFESLELAGETMPYAAETGTSLEDSIAPYGILFVTFDANAQNLVFSAEGQVSAQLVTGSMPPSVIDVIPGQLVTFDGVPRVLVLTATEKTPFELSVGP